MAQVMVPVSGSFEQSFIWPSTLVNQPGQEYSICAQNAQGHVISSKDDPGPFTVLTPNPPAFSLSTNSIAAGGAINSKRPELGSRSTG